MTILLAIWQFVSSRIGRWLSVIALCLVAGFAQGWALKSRIDRSATLRAVVIKQNIDLAEAKKQQDDDARTIEDLRQQNNKNQETVRDLSTDPAACVADEPTARRLRSIR